jgi:hypothetical protein
MSIVFDAASVDALVTALYQSISHRPGRRPDWERMRPLFAEGARIISPAREEEPFVALDFESYVSTVDAALRDREREGTPQGFAERDIARRTDTFGNIAHVWSTYESRNDADDPAPVARGINSFQFVFDRGRWWVMTILWDVERADGEIPERYLPEQVEEKS